MEDPPGPIEVVVLDGSKQSYAKVYTVHSISYLPWARYAANNDASTRGTVNNVKSWRRYPERGANTLERKSGWSSKWNVASLKRLCSTNYTYRHTYTHIMLNENSNIEGAHAPVVVSADGVVNNASEANWEFLFFWGTVCFCEGAWSCVTSVCLPAYQEGDERNINHERIAGTTRMAVILAQMLAEETSKCLVVLSASLAIFIYTDI